MTFAGVMGTFSYLAPIAMMLYALLTQSWSTMEVSQRDVPGIGVVSASVRMGLFSMRAKVIGQDASLPLVLYQATSYDWCSRSVGDSSITTADPIFSSHDHEYCSFLRATQLTAVLSTVFGLIALLASLSLSAGLVRYASRRHVSGLAASLVFFQVLTAFTAVVCWACIRKIANSDIQQVMGPGFKLKLSVAWFLMLAAAASGGICFGVLARNTPRESKSVARVDMDEEAERVITAAGGLGGSGRRGDAVPAAGEEGPAAHTYESEE